MARFYVSSEPAAAADAGEAIGNLWNPHASIAIRVYDVTIEFGATQAAAHTITLSRTSTIGTPGSTRTPDLDSHTGRRASPVSGTTLGQGNFTVNPTAVSPEFARAAVPTPIGTSVSWWFPVPIIVPGGSGLAVFASAAAAGGAISFRFEE